MNKNFDIHFVYKSQLFDIGFQENSKASKDTVLIDGRNYELHGDSSQIKWLKLQISELNNHSEISLQNLQKRLQSLGATDVDSTAKIHIVGVNRLLSSSKVSQKKDTVVEPGKGKAMNQLLESLVTSRGFSGTVFVVDHGKTILKSGYGNAKMGDEKPMSSTTRFPIGSVTKPITSLAILKLVEDGVFTIRDPAKIKILDFLPKSCQPGDKVIASWEGITLLDLMNHTAGLPSFSQKGKKIEEAKMAKKYPFLSADDVLKLSKKKRKGISLLPTEIHALMNKYPTLSSINKIFKLLQEEVINTPLSPQDWVDLVRNENLSETREYNYSNFGYILLGKIIENVSGDSYEFFMNHFLQDTLGLKETGYVGTDVSGAIYAEPLVWGHKEQSFFAADKNELDPLVEAYSAGGLYSTVEDLQLLSMKQMAGLKERNALSEKDAAKVAPIKDWNFRQDFTCTKGWNISSGVWKDSDGESIQEIWKTGAVGGYGSLIILYPNQNSSIVILSNQPSDVETIASDLSHILCVSIGQEKDLLYSWTGSYRIPNWGLTFSIAKHDSKYIFRETHPTRHEMVLDESSNAEQVFFGPWGREDSTHSIKEIEGQLCLCGSDGLAIPGALIEKIS